MPPLSHSSTWLYLILAIAFEVGWAVCLKASDGFSKRGPAVATLAFYALSLFFLMLAVRKLDVGTTYAIWAGAGAALIAVFGILYFKEPVSPLKIISLLLVIAGVVGLNLTEGHATPRAAPPGAPASGQSPP